MSQVHDIGLFFKEVAKSVAEASKRCKQQFKQNGQIYADCEQKCFVFC